MEFISEEDFDLLVHHTLRIELTDGSTLIYPILPKAKGKLIDVMRRLSLGDASVKSTTTLCFDTFPERTVFINTKYLLTLIFCFDSPLVTSLATYHDNFGILPGLENLEKGERKEDFLANVILKLAHATALTQSQTIVFLDIEPATLVNLDIESWEPQDGIRQFIELEDEDGEPNFFNLEHVMCLEVACFVVNEKDIDENLEDSHD